jgi:hypothetical protein
VRPLKKAAPLHHAHECTDCEGAGVIQDRDFEDDGAPRFYSVECEGCGGCGKLADCHLCDSPMPLTEAESLGHVCGPCRADHEKRDLDVERARLRRWVA